MEGKNILIWSTIEKDTKGTVRFKEETVMVDGEEALMSVVPIVYIRKDALTRLFGVKDPLEVKGIFMEISRADVDTDADESDDES